MATTKEFFDKMKSLVEELEGEVRIGNLADALTSIADISSMLAELEEELEFEL